MEEVVGIKITIDGSEGIKSIGEVRALLQKAQDDVKNLGSKFGDTSLEVLKAKQKVEDLQSQIVKSFKPVSLDDLKNSLKSIPQLNFKDSEKAIENLLGNEKLLEKSIAVLKDNLSKVDDNEGFTQVSRIIGTLQNKLEEVKANNKTLVQSFDQVASSIANAFKGTINTEGVKIKINVDGKEAEKSIAEFRNLLEKSKSDVIEFKVKFGADSKEVVEAKAKVEELQKQLAKQVDVLNIDDVVNVIKSIPKIDLGINEQDFSKIINDATSLKSLIESLKLQLNTAQTDEQFLAINSVVNVLDERLQSVTDSANEFGNAIDGINLSGVQLPKLDTKSLEYLNSQLVEAQQELEIAKEEFGQFSNEAIKASEKVLGIKVAISEIQDQSTKTFSQLNTELKNAETNVDELRNRFVQAGLSVEQAAALVIDLKKRIAEAGASGDTSIGELNNQLTEAEAILGGLNAEFLTTSKELVQAQENVTGLKTEIVQLEQAEKEAFNPDIVQSQAEQVGTLKSQYKSAVVEVQNIIDKYGITSIEAAKAASAAAGFRDRIGDANTLIQAFNPDAKFRAFAGSIQGVVSGFTAVQGALGVLGVKSDEVQKTLLKVQSALAVSQGLQGLFESIDTFKTLGTVIKSTTAYRYLDIAATKAAVVVQRLFTGAVETSTIAVNSLKSAFIKTGIGALVIALGYAISKLIDYVSANNDATTSEEKFKQALDNTTNSLDRKRKAIERDTEKLVLQAKLQGKSTEEIYQIQKKGKEKLIELDQSYLTQQGEFQKQIDAINKDKSLSDKERKDAIENVKKEIIKVTERVEDDQYDIEKTGYINRVTLYEKDASKRKELLGKRTEDTKNALKKIAELTNDIENAGVEDSLTLAENKLKQQAIIDEKDALRTKASESVKAELVRQIRKKLATDLDKLYEDTKEKELESLAGFEKTVNDLKFEIQKPNTSALDIARNEVEDKYTELQKQIEKIDISTTEGVKKRDALLAQLKVQKGKALAKAEKDVAEKSAKSIVDLELEYLGVRLKNSSAYRDQEIKSIELDYNKRIELAKQNGEDAEQLERIKQEKIDAVRLEYAFKDLDNIINSNTATYNAKIAAIDNEQKLLDEKYQKDVADAEGNYSVLTALSEQYTKDTQDLTEKRIQIADAEKVAKIEIAKQIGSSFGALSELLGKQTIAGKIAALAEIATGTGVGFIQGLDIAQKGAKAGGPAAPFLFPVFYATQIAAVLSAATKAKSILSSVKGPSSGGSVTPPTVRSEAPLTPQLPQQATTQLNQQSINQIGNAVFGRSYVLESDVTNQQERQRRLNRAARLT